MTNPQPFLTGFPTKLFGSAKRKMQDIIRQARAALIASSIGEYALQFEPFVPASLLHDLCESSRERHFANRTTFWAWMGQIIDQNASCSKAVSMVQSWCAQAGLPAPSSDTGAYCKARKRISMRFLKGIASHLSDLMTRRIRPEDLWHGFVLKAIDGTSVKLMDTLKNQEKYPQPTSQKPGCGFPVMGMVGILNLSHGGWDAFATAPVSAHDLTVTQQLVDCFKRGDLVLADRAFCSYELIAQLMDRGVECVMRLHQSRHRALDWRKGKRISKNERLVIWTKPAHQSQASQLSPEQWAALPQRMSIRLVKYHCTGRGQTEKDIIVATTLLDCRKHSAADVADVYGQRWGIELKIRDVKTTLGMEDFDVRTPDMAEKTLAMLMISYNLIKAMSQQAAIESGQSIGALGFKGVLDILVSYRGSYRGHQQHPAKRAELHATLIGIISTKLIEERPGRQEPRAVKKRPKPFPLLTKPRGEYVEIQHRSNYRAAA